MEEEIKEEIKEPETKQDKVLDLARQLGYNPDYDGDDKRTPEEFILNSKDIQKTMSKQMRTLRDEIEDQNRRFGDVKSHLDLVYKHQISQLKNEIADLKTRRKQAISDEDHEAVREIDERIEGLEKVSEEKPAESPQMSPAFKKWVDKNDWYREDKEMREYAEAQAKLNPKYAGLSQETFYKRLTEDVKEMFPDRFEKPAEPEPPKVSPVEGGGRKTTPKQKFTRKDLNESQLQILKDMEAHDIMKEADYIKQLVELGQLS